MDPVNKDPQKINSLCSDSDRRGIEVGLLNDLSKLNWIAPESLQWICTLYAILLMFNNLVEKFISLGGIKNNTIIQLLFFVISLKENMKMIIFDNCRLQSIVLT